MKTGSKMIFPEQKVICSCRKSAWLGMILAVLCLMCSTTASADEPLKAGRKYSISCKFASGYVSPGSVQGVSYPLYYVRTEALADTDDGYWYVEGNGEDGYMFRNAATSEYMVWCDDYTRCRYMDVSAVADDHARWTLEAADDGYLIIRSVAEPGYTFNLRTGTCQLGTYSGSYGDSNSLFRFEEARNAGDGDNDGGDFADLPHSDEYYFIQGTSQQLTVIPRDYVESMNLNGGKFTATLTGGLEFEQFGVLDVTEELPFAQPTFTSFEFDNKFNHQLYTDAKAASPDQAEVTVAVGAIGKRLTASFSLSDEKARAWVDGRLQESTVSRLRFEKPVCYTIGYDNWKEIRLARQGEGKIVCSKIPYGYKTTVTVDWLTDHATTAYGVPEIYITTDDGTSVTSKSYYWDAKMEINGAGVFPDMAQTPMQIRGRGNSSWGGAGSKNPYRLKFPLKVKPFGLPKSKSWVLLANKQEGSMTTNAIGHKIAHMMGSAGACDIIPVELYINGQYQGSYNFTEKVGFSNSSVDLTDDTYAAMIELDTYADEGKTNFHSNAYSISSKVHDPDVEEPDYEGLLDVHGIMADFDEMTRMVKAHDGSYVNKVDVEGLVSYLATAELMCHSELKHPKSVFLYSENVTDAPNPETGRDETPWIFGPLWDCDWAFGYEQNYHYYEINEAEDFFSDLIGYGSPKSFWNDLRYGSREVDDAYFARWKKFMTQGALEELLEYCDDYYAFASRSLAHNNSQVTSNRDGYSYADVTRRSRAWLEKRARYVYSCLQATHPEEDSGAGEKQPVDMAIVDGQDINVTEETPCSTLTYTRNFRNTNWQPLYVPFSMSFEDWDGQGLEVARLNGFYEYDDDGNGSTDRSALEVIKVKNGQLMPNHPYLVRATETGEKTISLSNTTLHPTTTTSVDCATVETHYTFIGTYSQVDWMSLNNWNAYIMSAGSLRPSSGTLGAMRWYMTREGRGGQLLSGTAEIKVVVRGEEDADGILEMAAEAQTGTTSPWLYNLHGQRVDRPASRGIYIRDGKKLMISSN